MSKIKLLRKQGDREDLRGRIHEVLERGKYREDPLRNKLKIAMPHVVHEINIGNISTK